MTTPRARDVEIGPDRSGQRLDNFLMRELGNVPRALVYRLIRTGQVRINGGRAKPMKKLATGDRVRVPPVRDQAPAAKLPTARIEQVRAAILHRQKEFLVLDKPSGLASQPGSGLAWGLNDLVAAIDEQAVPVHRLDRETSGVMVFALGRRAARELQQAFRRHTVDKRYLALLTGHLPEDRVVIDAPLKKIRDAGGQHRVVVDPDGQSARTTFKVLERFRDHDFVEAEIESGRTHQIRVHAAEAGAPVAGDDRYDPGGDLPGLERLFLHAAYLRLPWPDDQVFSAPLPDELTAVLDALRTRR
ncbi:RluA family pseudouridine synthase [Wenzhouxiangella sp. XN79A]|uniref:RluA family pseudouridine synthase n=1 Tax=Wenzhouxiangella sp. XN79A TaxID=2724193 RepID=UPI00144A6C0D|nr:RluA family pseudouridine synthase [Wenzhouxiangella sp. XN79A]NKI35488.1 RluA family pseudouridine synthase [Wenzhouxiangella sp. XN79A]